MFKKSLWNTWVQILAKVVTVLISLVVTGLLTRKLGPISYGSYTLITSVFLLLDSLADFGSKVIGVREAANNEGETRKKIYGQLILIRLLTTLGAFVIGLFFIFKFRGLENIKIEALLALIMIWFTSIAGSLEIVFQTELKMGLKVLVDILFPFLFLISLLLWRGNITLMWVFGAYLLTRIISLVWGWKLFKKILGDFKFTFLNKKYAADFLRMSWPMGVYMLVFTGYDRAVDSLMINRFIGMKEVAFYGLAYKIYSNLIQPAYYFVNSIFPILSGKHDKKRELFKISFLLILAGLIILIPLVYIFAPLMIKVLAGDGYESSIKVLRVLLIALIFAYVSHLVGFTLIARGGQRVMLKMGITALVVNFVANLIMIPKFGIMGAAWVTVLTESLMCILMILALKKTVNKKLIINN